MAGGPATRAASGAARMSVVDPAPPALFPASVPVGITPAWLTQ